jgi:hypothetical protein
MANASPQQHQPAEIEVLFNRLRAVSCAKGPAPSQGFFRAIREHLRQRAKSQG